MSKPRSNNNDNGVNDNNKDTLIASASKNHASHNVVFFVPVVVVAAAVDKGVPACAGASADCDAAACQLTARQEKEGKGPIVIKAAELQRQQ